MSTQKKISFIGFGNLASAITEGAIRVNALSVEQITVTSPSLSDNRRKTRFSIASSNCKAASDTDVIILAVKPQQMASVCREISSSLKNQLIISVAAGQKTTSIQKYLGRKDIPIIRAMPNTAVATGYGVTGLYANALVSKTELNFAHQLFEATGIVVDLEQEDELDFFTAFSGSGPAYFLYLQEALEKAAVQHGFSIKKAEKIVKQLMYGTSLLTYQNEATFKEKRTQITSEKGTTAEAITYLEQHDFIHLIENMLNKATLRAKALSCE